MKAPKSLHQSGKKITFAYAYVHDRFSLLPSYSDIISLWGLKMKTFGRNLVFGILIFSILLTMDIWTPVFMDFIKTAPRKGLQTIEQGGAGVRSFVRSLMPKPLPQVDGGMYLRNISAAALHEISASWALHIEVLSQKLGVLETFRFLPKFIEKNPDIFAKSIPSDGAGIRYIEEKLITPFDGFPLNGSRLMRALSLPFAEKESAFPPRFEKDIILLKSLTNFNNTNIQKYLSLAGERTQKLTEYLEYGKSLQTSARSTLANISAKRKVLESSEQTLETSSKEAQANFVKYLDAYLVQETDESLQDFISRKQQAVDKRANAGYLKTLEGRYISGLQTLERNLDAVEKNKEALTLGVKVTQVKGVDLGLIQ
ncbi:hypothetical protein HZA38_02195 [Candidatus Peregrinibacteria bacterium]|nr:hypothetical protein [Candidatus Peregrinibacteria bacterium]